MRRLTLLITVTAVATLAPCMSPVRGGDERRTREAFLEEVKAIGEPDFDPARKQEPGYLENYKREQHLLYRKKAALLLELCRTHPDDPRVPEWMNRRWVLLGWNQDPADVADEVLADIESVLKGNTDEQVARDGAYWRAYFLVRKHQGRPVTMMRHINGLVEADPKDERVAALLDLVASDASADRDLRISLYGRLAEQYPDTHYGSYAPGMIRRLEAIGKPFELSFEDAMTGRRVSVADLRGNVVLIDFWATTCVPCVKEMPHLKELYEKYRDKSAEFIGVSLDESEELGGLADLRKFLRKHDIPWPQYYQGNGYDSAFSKSWGVGSAPTMFLLDKRGRLRHTDVVGKVEELIVELLAE